MKPVLWVQDAIAQGPGMRALSAGAQLQLDRNARVKRRPHWLNNTIDPALAGMRMPLPDGCECLPPVPHKARFMLVSAGCCPCRALISIHMLNLFFLVS